MTWVRKRAVDVHDETAGYFSAEYSNNNVYDFPFRYGRSLIDAQWMSAIEGLPAAAGCLDIGSGIGAYMARLVKAGFNVRGIEPSVEMRKLARERVPAELVSDGSVTELPVDDGPPPRWCPAQPRGPPGAAGRLGRVGRLRARPRRRPAAAGPAHRRPRAGVPLVLQRDGGLEIEVGAPPAVVDGPVRLAVDPEPVDADDVWLRQNTTRRAVYAERAARWPEADDVVLTSSRGEVTETTIANLAVRLDGRWWTPPVSSGCLPGVERGRLVAEGRLHERPLTPADLAAAEELAVVNSLRGWRPAVLLQRHPAG